MKSMMAAALLVQMMTAGGAGSRGERAGERREADAGSVKENLSALKGEITSLQDQFRVARERARQEAERKKRESGEWTNEPTAPAAPASKRAAAPTGGN